MPHKSFTQNWTGLFSKPTPNMLLRLLVMTLGIAFVALGIAISRTTDLGLTAISAIPGVLNYATDFSLGTLTFVFNILMVLVQIALLRKRYNPLQLLCIPFIFVFASFIDFFVPYASLLPMFNYPLRLLFSFVSCWCIAIGVWLQKKTALVMLPGDGIVQTISVVTHKNFGKTKIAFDVSMIVSGAVLSLITMGGLYGVREGSVMAACIVGFIIRFIDSRFPHYESFAPVKGRITFIPQE